MALTRTQLAGLILAIVLVTLLVAFGFASLVLALWGDWVNYSNALSLTNRIMWGTWVVATTATVLTFVTMFGWRFRKLRPGEGPRALARALAAEIKPASLFKRGSTSFTITVVLVSLFGTAVLASVLIWIIGDWQLHRSPLVLSLKIIWGTWWVLCIATVLVRVALFNMERGKAAQAKAEAGPKPEPPAEDESVPEEKEPDSKESATGTTP
jgi:hypothetical protein